jgi:DNA helicase II
VASIADKVIKCLEKSKNFIVEAGAGAGKTHTLVEALSYLLMNHSESYLARGQQIVCITYTNIAADEIKSRINNDPLVRVSTIHDFLWSVMSGYQNELRNCLLSVNRQSVGSRYIDDLDLANVKIEYWQYGRKWREGKVHHDDVITLASEMFLSYPKLSRLVSDRYPVIFVDEYQDTQESVIRVLLDALAKENGDRLTIGFFGDYMQKIYETGVGRLNRPELETIQKRENYRCSTEVIKVLNKLRPSLQQVAAGDNITGSARFFYSRNGGATAIDTFRKRLQDEGWSSNEKILMLTRRSIAKSLGWEDMRCVYSKRGGFALDDLLRKDDAFSDMFQVIEDSVAAFNDCRYGDLYALLSPQSNSLRNKQILNLRDYKSQLSRGIENLMVMQQSATIGEVLDYVWSENLVAKTSRVAQLEERSHSDENLRIFFRALRGIPYSQVSALHRYLNDETPFSTKHGTKGEEYDDVLVVIDDNSWTRYKFTSVLERDESKPQYERSLNLFYVCCSRARRNLAVLMVSKINDNAIQGARRIFGPGQVVDFEDFICTGKEV